MKKYPEYKDSGIEWLGKIPEHWEVQNLGRQGKFSASGIDKRVVEGEPFVRMINYTDIYGNEKHELTAKREYMVVTCPIEKKKQHQVHLGDLIFTPSSETKDDIGISAVAIEELPNTVFSYHVIRLKLNGSFDINFRKYLCNNNFVLNQFSKEAKGTTRQIIGRDVFKTINVVIPPPPEQTAIANFLDHKTQQIDDLIERKKRLIELLKEERTGLINQAVTKGLYPNVPMKDSGIEWLGEIPEHWEIVNLKYLSKIRYGLGQPPKTKEDGLPIIRATNIKKGEITENDLLLVDPDDLPHEKNPILKEGEIIVVRSGAYTADSAIIPKKYAGSVTGYDLVLSSHSIESKLLSYILLSGYVLDNQLLPLSSRAAQPHLNAEELGSTLICVPPKNEQIEISNHLLSEKERINNLVAISISEIELLMEYKTSLINEAVTGKIDVRDYHIENITA